MTRWEAYHIRVKQVKFEMGKKDDDIENIEELEKVKLYLRKRNPVEDLQFSSHHHVKPSPSGVRRKKEIAFPLFSVASKSANTIAQRLVFRADGRIEMENPERKI